MNVLKKFYKSILKNLDDNTYITISYLRRFKKIPNIKNPKYFSEKIHCIKVSNWLEDKQGYVDKYSVRGFISNTIGNKYLINLIAVYDNAYDIKFDDLPNSFVLKLNNGSGYNLIVKDKNELNYEETVEKLNSWLKSDFYKSTREKQYKGIEQVIICEEYLSDDSGDLRDYKLFCFNGKFKFVQVDTGRHYNHNQSFYDKNWNKLNFTYACGMNDYIDKKPKKFKEMIEIAETLSKEFPFVRIDLYYVNNRIYFGEITFTPNNGMMSINPIEKDIEIASWIDIDKYRNMC